MEEQFAQWGDGSEQDPFRRVAAGPVLGLDPESAEAGGAAPIIFHSHPDLCDDDVEIVEPPRPSEIPVEGEFTGGELVLAKPRIYETIAISEKDHIAEVIDDITMALDNEEIPYDPSRIGNAMYHLMYAASTPEKSYSPSELARRWDIRSVYAKAEYTIAAFRHQ